jgi:hypothetical protein
MYLIRGRTLFSCFFEPNFSCSTPATKWAIAAAGTKWL